MRIALGAQGRRVIALVLADGLRFAGAGSVAGMLGSLTWFSGGANHTDRWLAGALGVGWPAPRIAGGRQHRRVLPARRAMTVDPLTSSRKAVRRSQTREPGREKPAL